MVPVGGDFYELVKKSDEELLAMVGAVASEHSLALPALRALEYRRVKAQSVAAAALVEATTKQASAATALVDVTDSLVTATRDLAGFTNRLATATWALVAITVLLVLAAGFQAYVMFKWHP